MGVLPLPLRRHFTHSRAIGITADLANGGAL
jgi:hypothetical protein